MSCVNAKCPTLSLSRRIFFFIILFVLSYFIWVYNCASHTFHYVFLLVFNMCASDLLDFCSVERDHFHSINVCIYSHDAANSFEYFLLLANKIVWRAYFILLIVSYICSIVWFNSIWLNLLLMTCDFEFNLIISVQDHQTIQTHTHTQPDRLTCYLS